MAPPISGNNHLLKLPAELRNDIFRLVFLQDKPIRIVTRRSKSAFEQTQSCSPLPLPDIAATSKQFRREALSIYYGEHTFVLTEPTYINECGYMDDLRMFGKWAISAKDFGRFLTSIRTTYGDPAYRLLQCTQEVCRREHGTREFSADQFHFSATTESTSDAVNGRITFKLVFGGLFSGEVGISPDDRPVDVHRDRLGVPLGVCIIELASKGRVHRNETLQLRGDAEDVGLLNGTLRAVSTILNARALEICCSCGRLMLRT